MEPTEKESQPSAPPDAAAALIESLDEHDAPNDSAAVERLIVELDEGEQPELAADAADDPRKKFTSFDEFVTFEETVSGGAWRAWPEVEGAEVLVGSFGEVIMREARLEAKYKLEKGLDRKVELPDGVRKVNEAKARFRVAVMGWRGAFFEGKPFGWKPFARLWLASTGFRGFVNAESVFLRDRLAKEADEMGKGSKLA